MAVICISIIQSEAQIVAGIPKTITFKVNIPSIIFYTLDGTIPTVFSTQYVGPITLPVGTPSITVNYFAYNGTDASPVISEIFSTEMTKGNTRLAHSATTVQPETSLQGLYPFGDNDIENGRFLNPADSGVTVFNPERPARPTGFGGDGYPTGYTNKPFDSKHYNIVYSTRDAEGESGPGIGNLPATVTTPANPDPANGPEQTSQFTTSFDPRAFVIFQDFKNEDPNDPPQINRQFFTLENPERARDGNAFFNSGLDAPPVSGSFLRSHYNPRTNEMTYYYLDTWTNKWIISTAPYAPTGTFDGNMSQVYSGRNGTGNGMVFEWLPFTRRVLF